jgi:NTE family protein
VYNPSSRQLQQNIGLVLSGGGARGAYQAGVLKGIGEICSTYKISWPFPIMTGLSAGAINVSFLAASSTDFYEATSRLTSIWSSLRSDDVFRTDPASLSAIGGRWLTSILTGGRSLSEKPQSLVDTSPLRRLLSQHITEGAIEQNLTASKFESVCVSATEYATSRGVSFIQSRHAESAWDKPRSLGLSTTLSIDHVLASSAIPVLFPAININGAYYGDGCLRNLTPLSPAIRLGSEKILVIGVRHQPKNITSKPSVHNGASAGRVLSVLLNAVLMDGLESDLDNLNAINRLLSRCTEPEGKLRQIPVFMLRPSVDIAAITSNFTQVISPLVRYLTRGLGPYEESAEMISYLLFEPEFCQTLIEIGHSDAMHQAADIAEFLTS